MKQPNIDKLSQEFVNYLTELSRMKLELLRESFGIQSGDIKDIGAARNKRMASLGGLLESASDFCPPSPPGSGRMIPGPHEIIPPYGTPDIGVRPTVRCNLKQVLEIEEANHTVLGSDNRYSLYQYDAKGITVSATANPELWDESGYAHAGFITAFDVPEAEGTTSVEVISRLSSRFTWVEANAIGDHDYAHVSSIARLWVIFNGTFISAVDVPFVNMSASDGEVLSHDNMETTSPGAVQKIELSVPAGSGETISVFETIEQVANTPNGHCFISGHFDWAPLEVRMREGCRQMLVPGYGYWGEV